MGTMAGTRVLCTQYPDRVTIEEQKALIKSAYTEIHHQGHTKVHHVLYSLYYWLEMDSTIEAVCTACARCIKAKDGGKS
jgi:hypothetical protein